MAHLGAPVEAVDEPGAEARVGQGLEAAPLREAGLGVGLALLHQGVADEQHADRAHNAGADALGMRRSRGGTPRRQRAGDADHDGARQCDPAHPQHRRYRTTARPRQTPSRRSRRHHSR